MKTIFSALIYVLHLSSHANAQFAELVARVSNMVDQPASEPTISLSYTLPIPCQLKDPRLIKIIGNNCIRTVKLLGTVDSSANLVEKSYSDADAAKVEDAAERANLDLLKFGSKFTFLKIESKFTVKEITMGYELNYGFKTENASKKFIIAKLRSEVNTEINQRLDIRGPFESPDLLTSCLETFGGPSTDETRLFKCYPKELNPIQKIGAMKYMQYEASEKIYSYIKKSQVKYTLTLDHWGWRNSPSNKILLNMQSLRDFYPELSCTTAGMDNVEIMNIQNAIHSGSKGKISDSKILQRMTGIISLAESSDFLYAPTSTSLFRVSSNRRQVESVNLFITEFTVVAGLPVGMFAHAANKWIIEISGSGGSQTAQTLLSVVSSAK